MLYRILHYVRQRIDRRRQKRYRDGWRTAAGILLKDPSPQGMAEVANMIETADLLGERDAYEDGAEHALSAFQNLRSAILESGFRN